MAISSDFARFYEAEHGRLSRLLRRMAGSAEAAEDIAHDAFLKLSGRNIGEADIGLLVRTAQNLARDAKRAERVRAAYAGGIIPDEMTPRAIAPDEATAAKQELLELFEALKTLPQRVQRVLLLSRLDEMTYPQIAKKLGVSVSTVEKDMVSALEFCRAWRRKRDFF